MLRVYVGGVRRGDFVHNVNAGKRIKVPRLVRMHSDEMEVGSGYWFCCFLVVTGWWLGCWWLVVTVLWLLVGCYGYWLVVGGLFCGLFVCICV